MVTDFTELRQLLSEGNGEGVHVTGLAAVEAARLLLWISPSSSSTVAPIASRESSSSPSSSPNGISTAHSNAVVASNNTLASSSSSSSSASAGRGEGASHPSTGDAVSPKQQQQQKKYDDYAQRALVSVIITHLINARNNALVGAGGGEGAVSVFEFSAGKIAAGIVSSRYALFLVSFDGSASTEMMRMRCEELKAFLESKLSPPPPAHASLPPLASTTTTTSMNASGGFAPTLNFLSPTQIPPTATGPHSGGSTTNAT